MNMEIRHGTEGVQTGRHGVLKCLRLRSVAEIPSEPSTEKPHCPQNPPGGTAEERSRVVTVGSNGAEWE
ncbi:hypothetical protein E2C01_074310 [Portunus trituberculatus]|uniref:Uncharacterized protein n=1 Tax=Portunus trituberculatus TaxID=210409 RepID=A0A5B7IGR7_PORTR|nr:hypothetical protein [Portunus trituberculatus]